MSESAQRRWEALVTAGTALFAFGMPGSTACVAIGGFLLLVAVLLRPMHVWRSQPWKPAVMGIGLALLAFIAVRTIAVDGFSSVSWHRINSYQELLLAPLLLGVWQSARTRRVFFAGWMAGCISTAVAFWVAMPFDDMRAQLAMHRISSGFAFALAAYLLVLRAPAGPRGRMHWIAAAFLAATIVFPVDSRTGLLILVLLAAGAAWARSPLRWRWATAIAAPLAVMAVALASPGVDSRIQEMRDAVHSTAVPNEIDSTAIRIQLLRITREAVREHWLAGVGFAHYAQAHEEAVRKVYAGRPELPEILSRRWAHVGNPHDEYVLQLVGGGIAALALFLAWLVAAAWRADAARAGLVLAFAVGCIFNSLLLDFMEGHIYVALLAWLLAERKYAVGASVERIAVVATRQIGDVLLTTPLIHAARTRWPQARIEVIGLEGSLGMLRGNADVDALIETPARGWQRFALAWHIARRYDLALVTDIGDRAHLIGFVAARERRGIIPVDNASNWWKRMLLDRAVVAAGDRGDVHAAAEKLSLIDAKTSAAPLEVRAPEGKPLPDDVAALLHPGFVVVHAPSMWSYKQWPIDHFARLIEHLGALGRQVVLTGSSSARDQECISPLRSMPGVVDVSGRLDFNQLVTLMQRAALYVGPDTSVSHLAAAAGVPVIAIFGPTNPARWAPISVRRDAVTVLQSGLPCVPCGRAGCEDRRDSRSDCLPDISPEKVMDAVKKVLAT